MKIRKAYQGTVPENKILDTYSTSTTDSYSANYVNSIIESGSNANGNYVKYADGTMICYGIANTNAEGYITINFPISFTSVPTIAVAQASDSETTNMITVKLSTRTTSNFRAACVYSGGYLHQYLNYIAIGKWK